VAAPPTAAANTVTRVKTLGHASIAEFNQVEGCFRTRIEIFANVNEVKGAPAPDKIVLVAISKLNQCTNLSVIEGFGQALDISLVTAANLRSSSLKASVPFTNFLDASFHTVTLDLKWEATAAKEKTLSTDVFESDGVVFTSRAAVVRREAVATGTVKMNTETLIDSGDTSRTASINQAKLTEKTRKNVRP
jgi:hypothetical protein